MSKIVQTLLPPFSTPKHKIQRIGLGLAALGRPGYINLGHAEDLNKNYDKDQMQSHAHAVLDKAWDAGVRYFDTARSYGLGELFLGDWVRGRKIPTHEVAIGSKWGYTYTADWQIQAMHHEVKEHSLSVLNRQWEESQETLGQYLDLYHIHSATLESAVLENVAVLKRLSSLKEEGIAIGLSLSGANQGVVLDKALDVQIDGVRLFDAVQATYNLLEPSVGTILATAHQEGLAVIIKEALANGRLTARNSDPDFSDAFDMLSQAACEHNCGIDAIALAGVLSKPWVDVVLSGAATLPHLLSNLQAVDIEWTDDLNQRFSSIVETPEQYWQRRKQLAWN